MGGKVVPIEVKSGKSYKTHKALDNLMKIEDYHLEKGFVFSIGNIEKEDKITYLPIYMSYLLKRKKDGQDDYKFRSYRFIILIIKELTCIIKQNEFFSFFLFYS